MSYKNFQLFEGKKLIKKFPDIHLKSVNYFVATMKSSFLDEKKIMITI